jgi:hypothetical protein
VAQALTVGGHRTNLISAAHHNGWRSDLDGRLLNMFTQKVFDAKRSRFGEENG